MWEMELDAFEEFEKSDDTSSRASSESAEKSIPSLNLNPLAIETLLNQSSNLLDRILANRATFETLGAKEYLQSKETEIAKSRLEDLSKLVANRAYERKLKFLQGKHENLGHELSNLEEQRDFLVRRRGSSSRTKRDTFVKASAETAYNGIRVPYIWANNSQSVAYQVTSGDFGTSKPVDDYMKILARKKAEYQVWNEKAQLDISKLIKNGEIDKISRQRDTLLEEIKFEKIQASVERTRLESEISKLSHFIKGRTDLNHSPLSSEIRLTGLKLRIGEDFKQAEDRMRAVNIGLRFLYKRKADLPELKKNKSIYFDECVVWVREQIQWLLRVKQNDEEVLLPISVRAAGKLPDDYKFEEGKECPFELNSEHHPDWKIVRLTGFSAFIVGWNTEKGFFDLEVELPPLEIGSETSLHIHSTLSLPNVTAYNPNKMPGFNNSYSLVNRPISGNWSLKIKNPIKIMESEDIDKAAVFDIVDIVVVLKLTKQSIH